MVEAGEAADSRTGSKVVSDNRAVEFAEAYREEFGEEISPEEASILLHKLTEFYFMISMPLPGDTPAKH